MYIFGQCLDEDYIHDSLVLYSQSRILAINMMGYLTMSHHYAVKLVLSKHPLAQSDGSLAADISLTAMPFVHV